MVLFFQLIFAWATPAMDAIDAFVARWARRCARALPAGLATDFLVDGVIAGVGSVVVFLPQILLLFTLLHLLEDLGYMARAAFVVDRLMGRIGLEGRAFVALLSSYACAVPGIMATRTIPSPRQRLVTILVSPLMTCSARLPGLRAADRRLRAGARRCGASSGSRAWCCSASTCSARSAALAAASLLSRDARARRRAPVLSGAAAVPRAARCACVASQVWGAARAFLRRAGTIILARLDRALGAAQLPARARRRPGSRRPRPRASRSSTSAAGRIGHALEPAIAPLGFDWKIGVGLVASLAAREVIVATLAQIYAASDDDAGSLREAIRADRDPRTGRPVFTPATVASLLVFFVFALQCMSTLATMRRETNSWRWPAFAFGYLLALAWGASFVTHRIVECAHEC